MGLENGIGLDIVLWFQSWRSPFMETFNLVMDFLGNEAFIFFVLPLIYWCIDSRLGRRLIFIGSLAGWSILALKDLIASPRPYMVSDQVRSTDEPLGYSMPSWHVGMSTVLWGVIGTSVKRNWYNWLITIYILLMAVSRLSMGVHFPQDLIAAVLLGLVWLGVYIRFEKPVSAWVNAQSMWVQVGLVSALTAALLLIYPVLIKPAGQDELDGVITVMAGFWGGIVGIVLETHSVSFLIEGAWWKRALRLVMGLAVIMGIRFGLGMVFEGLEPAQILRFVRYGLMGLWIGLGAPWVFVKTGLASARTS